MSTFWDFFWLMVWMFFFITYLIVLFQVIVDLFRDHELNGWAKAAWVIALIFLPLLTTLAYLIFRGGGMGKRQMDAAYEARAETENYIRRVAGTSPAEQISHASALLKDGAISQAEFDRLKAKALA
ncbi:SHOCT domain-containing protein [Devosia sediminis]|uniref:PLDc N-terminal domain-containing protein n=1 Tax=Devosia sediminis TaxID=2798801 RepID=A0A934MML7_9HYPH|nr:SHOCT domain-containing protein [Devosia sediminis]MBJ3786345.1 PLDc N-terminal domain-containing protein [Devosia sediminis]